CLTETVLFISPPTSTRLFPDSVTKQLKTNDSFEIIYNKLSDQTKSLLLKSRQNTFVYTNKKTGKANRSP
ncbi:MAG: hypothetical protein ABF624_04260, partial [Liquorilactobacillus ghanensis]|uniref:hypothetical protein n=1 Tax=Liquorilactobacillus ghanensis TaxID=399370 RepID=UPI0039EAA88B